MTRRAHFTQADYTRAIKGAVAAGWPVGSFKLVVEEGRLTILPVEPADAPSVASNGYGKALEKWRRSA